MRDSTCLCVYVHGVCEQRRVLSKLVNRFKLNFFPRLHIFLLQVVCSHRINMHRKKKANESEINRCDGELWLNWYESVRTHAFMPSIHAHCIVLNNCLHCEWWCATSLQCSFFNFTEFLIWSTDSHSRKKSNEFFLFKVKYQLDVCHCLCRVSQVHTV